MSRKLGGLLMVIYILIGTSCYSLKGISIDPSVNTYYVENFIKIDDTAPIDIEVTFAELLRANVRTESRLRYTETEPDVTFSGSITSFNVSAEAPSNNTTVDLNKLTISVQVKYASSKNEKDGWNKNYSQFRTYSSATDLQTIQDELIREIFNQITESVFNDAFANW